MNLGAAGIEMIDIKSTANQDIENMTTGVLDIAQIIKTHLKETQKCPELGSKKNSQDVKKMMKLKNASS